MKVLQGCSRTNLLDCKQHLQQVLGPAVHTEYWRILRSYVGLKLTRAELDALVPRTIGRNNVRLHNELIKAIYVNAVSKKVPPLPPEGLQVLKSAKTRGDRSEPLTPLPVQGDAGPLQGSNGAVKGSPAREKKANSSKRKSREERGEGLARTRALTPPEVSQDGVSGSPLKRARREAASTEAKRAPELAPDAARVGPIRAPLGLPFCSASLGGALQPSPLQPYQLPLDCTLLGLPVGGVDAVDLPDFATLKKRMVCLAVFEGGLRGVSTQAVAVMSNALDYYLKSIISSCVQLARAKKQWQSSGEFCTPSSSRLQVGAEGREEGPGGLIGPTDLMAALEVNPQLLGDEMAVALERALLLL